ncbi:MAG: hypothetical protein NTY91_08175 [Euryarchaeota archaeon]|nr:hypothetical protein [Euryarchaeota archaeon]
MKKQIIATTIILLFIGVAVAPSINTSVVKASNDNDLVEVTTQACGIQGFGNTTVKLTKQQCQDLEQYLVDFRARLNQTSTREEAVPIFKEAVVELDKYGLLPKGMSVEQAQKLILGRFHKSNTGPMRSTWCFVAGSTSNTIIWTPLTIALGMMVSLPLIMLYLLEILAESYPFLLFLYLPAAVCILPVIAITFLSYYFPGALTSIITLGQVIKIGKWQYISSDGWVKTIGLTSNYWTGEFYGQFKSIPGIACERYPGIIGFTGIKLCRRTITEDALYFGSALAVDIDYN